ncbi:related to TDP1 Tyr-DNA phosphodiesterase [Cephalotrichum gorgonifer]|uniref:Related to TDP1 Tyr-DNA phosphodiesterase n=1 Tax=Cephalotrichum gorgonifer TaxID=2041049 RepID=A0AAE8MUW7_9PEZI|nr:related to TDP1 Tyr-DNA phosphodiesterase [Cephalotrichum gorgonifer]
MSRRAAKQGGLVVVKSPFQLIQAQGLPDHLNQDTVTLKDILGDPLIRECWNFNFMHDIDFIRGAFDEDTRHLVKLHIVHGNWKREDPARVRLEAEAACHDNVFLHTAFMPEMFGTHHSKMMIILRHDDAAQVIIHTANSIVKDWTTLTNAVWRSPLLPLLKSSATKDSGQTYPLGSGERFKEDLLNYLRAYDEKRVTCRALTQELSRYDFSSVKGALIASVPGRHRPNSSRPWGWVALKEALGGIPTQDEKAEVVVQISSIATLGAKDTWLRDTFFKALSASRSSPTVRPKFKVVYPTADEIRRSIGGYESGGSIHMRTQSQQQEKQLEYMKPMFHHWSNDASKGEELEDVEVHNSGRNRVAPHIKTYIRQGSNSIDWALLTSANLSKQAWGEAVNSSGEVRLASWEIGVLVWPDILAEGSVMVGTFQTDTPSRSLAEGAGKGKAVVGLRMPYSMPIQKYGKDEIPWVPSMAHAEPDSLGRAWGV